MKVIEHKNLVGKFSETFDFFKSATEGFFEELRNNNAILVRGFFPATLINQARQYCIDFASHNDALNQDISLGCANYHRIDDVDNNPKIKIKRVQHRYFFLPWNAKADNPVDQIGSAVAKFRNAVVDMPEKQFVDSTGSKDFVHWTVLQYPRGGGFLDEHQDPLLPAMCEVGVCLSSYGVDYKAGGLWIKNDKHEKIAIEPLLNPGDVVLFSQDNPHGVDYIDPDLDVNWKAKDGRWTLIIPVRPALKT